MYETDPESGVLWAITSDNPASRLGVMIGLNAFPHGMLPQDPPFPCCLYTVVGVRRTSHLDGPDGCSPFRVQFDLYGRTVQESRRMRRSLLADMAALKNLEVPISPPVLIYGAFPDNEADSVDRVLERAGTRVRPKSLDVIVWIKE